MPTFVYRDDVWMAERRHDFDLSADVHHVLFIFNLLLTNGFNRHLRNNTLLKSTI